MPQPKKPTALAPAKQRTIRTPEQIVADLEAKIEAVKTRAKVKRARRSPELKALVQAVRSIDASLAEATDATLKTALTEGRAPLVAYLQLEGLPVPQKRKAEREEAVAATA